MPDDQDQPSISINISIEELHLHYPSIESDAPLDVDVETGFTEGEPEGQADAEPRKETPDGFGEGAPGPRPGGYDIRDRPANGLSLQTVAESDGVTAGAVADIHDLNAATVRNALNKLHERRAVTRGTENDEVFYHITDFGERVLDDWKERWRQGYRNLPNGYWEGVSERNPA